MAFGLGFKSFFVHQNGHLLFFVPSWTLDETVELENIFRWGMIYYIWKKDCISWQWLLTNVNLVSL